MKILQDGVGLQKSDRLARGIRQCLDSQGRAPASRSNEPDSSDRRLQAPCTISLDRIKTPTAAAWTGKIHGVTEDGAAVLVEKRIAPGSFVWIEVRLPEGGTAQLTGHVVDSTALNRSWHLTRIRFSEAGSSPLPVASDSRSEHTEREGRAKTKPTVGRTAIPQEPEVRSDMEDRRERDLRILRSVARNGISNKESFRDVARLTNSPDHIVRMATIPALFQIRGSEAALALINLLRDPNASIQTEVAETLGHLDDERAIAPLAELLEHRNVEVALRAAEALGRLGDPSGLKVAIKFLRSDHEHTPLAARACGVILKERFRPGLRGVTEARLFLKRRK